uniref:Dolichyldiphosphatase n=1 Tax=Gallus gallus TaxID=9031 RepID=A0A8V1AF52_CHICK
MLSGSHGPVKVRYGPLVSWHWLTLSGMITVGCQKVLSRLPRVGFGCLGVRRLAEMCPVNLCAQTPVESFGFTFGVFLLPCTEQTLTILFLLLFPEAHSTVTTKYGMPSSHSQFMWFFSVYSFLFLYLRMHQTNNARFLDLLWRHVLSICLVTVALLVSYSRVYLLYHTWSQVLYGGVAGSVMAIAWFAFTQEILTPLFPRIAAWPISEFFLIRDTSLIPNILWFEYTVTRAEARNRQRKLGTKLQ